MALRLDLEEKVAKIEKAHVALLSKLKTLQNQAVKDKEEVDQLKSELAKEQRERTARKDALEKAKIESKSSSAKSME